MAKRGDRGLDRPLDRDEVDWDDLVRQYRPRLRRRVARHVPDPAIVDDVVQEAFIQAYASWPTYDQSRSVGPWLATIALNGVWQWSQASQLVAEVDRRDSFAEEPLLDYFAVGSDDHVANIDRRAAMRKALGGMTAKHRRILLAWELGDRSVPELAAAEGMTPEALRATVVRARQSLRRRYFDAAGDGPFGWVVVGLSGFVARWRDRLTRAASSGGWAEAAGSLAAAPVVAVAGMAMISLVPTPAEPVPRPQVVAEQPVAVMQETASGPSDDNPPVKEAPTSVGAALLPPAPAPTAPTPGTPTFSAGPAVASVTSGPAEKQAHLTVSTPTGDAEWKRQSETYCESVVAQALCEVRRLVPPGG